MTLKRCSAVAGVSCLSPIVASFSTRIDRRVRYWVDGIVIGSEQFVRETLAHSRGRLHQAQRPLFAARDASDQPLALYSFRRLRSLLQ